MNDLSNKSSEELAAELRESIPDIMRYGTLDWRKFLKGGLDDVYTAQKLYLVSQLVLAQQREIEQLKAELEELKKR